VSDRVPVLRSSMRLFLVLFAAAIAVTGSEARAQDVAGRIERYLTNEVTQRGIPGLAAAVVRNGKVIYLGAHGLPKLGRLRNCLLARVSSRASRCGRIGDHRVATYPGTSYFSPIRYRQP